MIEFYSLFSSSKANAYLIKTEKSTILIDAGQNKKKLKESLHKLNVKYLDAIIITHEHQDHSKGIEIYKEFNAKIYTKFETFEILNSKYNIENYEFINSEFSIDDIIIKPFNLMHDAINHIGLEISYEEISIIHITDTGYLSQEILSKIKNKTVYCIESNYDEEKLMESSRPLFLKKRIISDTGHLSNIQTNSYLKQLIGDKTTNIFFLHLSEEVNSIDEVLKINNDIKIKMQVAKSSEIVKIKMPI